MKILKVGTPNVDTTQRTCGKCDTLFEYSSSDVKHDSRDGGYYLYCPHCGVFILIKGESYSFYDQTDRSKYC